MKSHRLAVVCVLAACAPFVNSLSAAQPGASPVKVYVLIGQSNMEGQGELYPGTTPGTLQYVVANDPASNYQFLVVSGTTNWVARDDVWIHYERLSGGLRTGNLEPGYGASAANTTMGPELGFGHSIGNTLSNQVLLIKTSWGGRSLGNDFLPPSSGANVAAAREYGDPGYYYQQVLRLVQDATSRIGTYFTNYDGRGCEIAGICWHQGWNDRVSTSFSASYQTNMANFIRDIRSTANGLGVPNLPFVIATTGMDGSTNYTQVERAQLAMTNATLYPDFAGNVAVIDTRTNYAPLNLDFWQAVTNSPADQNYHWNRNAKTYLHIGLAMGREMPLLAVPASPSRLLAAAGPSGVTLTWQNGTNMPASVQVLRDGAEIAAAAPVSPATFLDAAALPGLHQYHMVFSLPGGGSTSLTVTNFSGITGLIAYRSQNGVMLQWSNNLAYAGIQVSRNGGTLQASWSGAATSYEDTTAPSSGTISYSVVPTTGDSAPAAVQINLGPHSAGSALIYEPFDFASGGSLSGATPSGVGLSNTWTRTSGTDSNEMKAQYAGMTYGALPVRGNLMQNGASGGSRANSVLLGTTLSSRGLLANGATLWFSILVTPLVSANSVSGFGLSDGNATYYNTPVNAVGISIVNGSDLEYWNDVTGAVTRVTAKADMGLYISHLIAGKLVWGNGGTNSTLELYTPDINLNLGSRLGSVMSFTLDPAKFDRLAIYNSGGGIQFDEIRLGATYESVIGASATNAPVASFTAAPTAGSAPLQVVFTDTSGNEPTGWAWDFDNDGGTDSFVRNPTNTYAVAGTYSVKLVATNAYGSGTNVQVGLVVVTEAVTNPVLAVSPASLNFGTVVTGVTAYSSFAVTNAGVGTLNVTASAGGAFGVAPGSFSLAAGSGTNVSVSFTPTGSGGFSTNVVFDSNGGVSTNPVSGTGALTRPPITNAWDGGSSDIASDGDGASGGGSGTWNTAIANWDAGAGLPHATWVNVDNDTAVFGGAAGTVSLGEDIAAGGLAFTTAGYVITNATLTLGGSSPTVSGAANATISSTLAGSAGLTKSGVSTITLNGSAVNPLAGGLILAGGTLLADFANLGTPTDLINSGNTLALGGGSFSVKGKSSGTTSQTLGNVAVNSGGGQILGNRNGGASTTVALGSLTATASGGSLLVGCGGTAANAPVISTGSNKDAQDIYGGRVVFFNGTANTGYDWATTSSGAAPNTFSAYGGYTTLPSSGGSSTVNYKMNAATALGDSFSVNTLKLEASVGDLDLGGNTLTIEGGGLLVTGTAGRSITGTSGATSLTAGNGSGSYDLIIHQFNSGSLTISARIGDNGGNPVTLVKAGSQSLNLNTNNTYSGGTIINAGTVSTAALGAATPFFGTGPVTVNPGATLALNRTQLTNSLTLNNCTVSSGNSFGSTLSGPITLVGVSTFSVSGGLSIPGKISGTGGLIKSSTTMAVPVTGTNTYTGPTTLSQGGMVFMPASLYNADSTFWTPSNISVAGSAVLGLYFSDAGTLNGSPDFSSAQVGTLLANLTSGINSNGLRAGSIIAFDTSHGSGTYASNIQDSTGTGGGTVGVNKIGANALTLSGDNTFSGPVTIGPSGTVGGTLRVYSINSVNGGTPPLATSSLGRPVTAANGRITCGNQSNNQGVGLTYLGTGETTDRVLVMNAGVNGTALTLDQSGTGLLKFTSSIETPSGGNNRILVLQGSTTGTGEIAGSISNLNATQWSAVIKSGTGVWTLSGTSTYTGVTTVNSGTLAVYKLADGGSPSSVGQSGSGSTNLLLGSGATLMYVGPGDSSDRQFRFNGNAAGLTVALDASGSGPVLFTSMIGPTHGTANQTRTLVLTGTNTGANTLAMPLADNGMGALSLIKIGVGTWVLTGTNTYGGATTVNNGTLRLGADGALSAVGGVVLSGTGTLDMGSASNTVATLAVTGTNTIVLGAGRLSFANSSAVGWTGGLTLTGSLGRHALRFGTGTDGLTDAQIARIKYGSWALALDADGYLVSLKGTGVILFVR